MIFNGQEKQSEAIGTIENITEEKAIEKRYAQEEKFRQAMLSETLSVWAVNLTERKLLSYTRGKKDCMPGLKSIVYDKKLIEGMCRLAHPKDKERVSGLLDAENTQISSPPISFSLMYCFCFVFLRLPYIVMGFIMGFSHTNISVIWL